MTNLPTPTDPLPRIHTPCPKRWDELIGDDRQRFCSACSLHVHNGSALTRTEATELVRGSTGRVCMRLEYDPAGVPVFRRAPRRLRLAASAAAWVMSAAAALLAACARTTPADPTTTPGLDPCTTNTTTKMGKVRMGDVAPPRATVGEVELGGARLEPEPPAPQDGQPTLR